MSENKKLALVNLANPDYNYLSPTFREDISFLQENNLEFIDYFSQAKSKPELLANFHAALQNPEIDKVWFVCGGSSCIQFLDQIDWDLVKNSQKKFMGSSDFTHFGLPASLLGISTYYGVVLKKVKIYWPSTQERQYLVDFLKAGILPKVEGLSLKNKEIRDFTGTKFLGGHLSISNFLLDYYDVKLEGESLFLEHHYNTSETLDYFGYWLDQLLLLFKKLGKPKEIVFGSSRVFDENQNQLENDQILACIRDKFEKLDLPIYFVDHENTIICG